MRKNKIIKVLLCSPYGKRVGGISKWTGHILNYYSKNETRIDLKHFYLDKGKVYQNISFISRIYVGVKSYIPFLSGLKKELRTETYDVVHIASSASISLIKDIFALQIANKKGANTMVNKNNGNKSMYGRYMGQINKYKQISLIRNCLFEPSQDKTLDAYYCLKGIETMFKYKKPAIICSHRLNYIGELDYKNRNNSLKDLSFLLKTIVSKHPDVEFMFSDELGNIINKNIEI